MADIDLIPAEYAVLRVWRRRLIRIGWMLLLVTLATVGARGWLGWRIATERPAVDALRKADQAAQTRRNQLQALDKRHLELQRKQEALDGWRDGSRWPAVLRAVDAAYHPKIWFDQIDYLREPVLDNTPPPAAAAAAAAAPTATSQSAGLRHRFEIVGHALSHAAVTEFIGLLEDQPGIDSVALTESDMRRYSMADIVDFRLAGVITSAPETMR